MTWLSRVNNVLAVVWVLLLLLTVAYFFRPIPEVTFPRVTAKKTALPENAFKQSDEAYENLAGPWLALDFVPPSLRLPDLSKVLTYHGKNNRPDVQGDQTLVHISLRTSGKNSTIQSVAPEEPIYLLYDRSSEPGRYVFSQNNEQSSLWISLEAGEEQAMVTVTMRGDDGQLISEPEARHQLVLAEKELPRFRGEPWEIGGIRVDGGLLARQRARWHGRDLFLEMHGGEAYAKYKGMQRISFGEADKVYHRFVGEGSFLIWKDDLWQEMEAGPDSWKLPLLQVKKVDERLIKFDLWDAEGKARVGLNLVKSREMSQLKKLQKDVRFVSARTRSQVNVEIAGDRAVISPQDWLLHTSNDGWVKLTTVEQIDDFVERRLIGELLIIDELVKRDNRQILLGHIFNATRSEMFEVEISADTDGMLFLGKEDESRPKPPVGRDTELTPDEVEQQEELRQEYMKERQMREQMPSPEERQQLLEELRDKRMQESQIHDGARRDPRIKRLPPRQNPENDFDDIDEDDLESQVPRKVFSKILRGRNR